MSKYVVNQPFADKQVGDLVGGDDLPLTDFYYLLHAGVIVPQDNVQTTVKRAKKETTKED
jgi:hypothetical protein